MPAASPAARVRFPSPVAPVVPVVPVVLEAPAGRAHAGSTGQEPPAACHPATWRRSRVNSPAGRCRRGHSSRPGHSSRADRCRLGCPRRASSRPDTQAMADPCPSVSSRAALVPFRPGQYRRARSCPAPACPTADRRLQGSLPRRARSLRRGSSGSSGSPVSSVPASYRVSRCRPGSSAPPGSSARPVSMDRPATSARPARLRLTGREQVLSRPAGTRPDRPGRARRLVPRGPDTTPVQARPRPPLTEARACRPALTSRIAGLSRVTTSTPMENGSSRRRPSTRQAG
jgi:hypothetical protein